MRIVSLIYKWRNYVMEGSMDTKISLTLLAKHYFIYMVQHINLAAVILLQLINLKKNLES